MSTRQRFEAVCRAVALVAILASIVLALLPDSSLKGEARMRVFRVPNDSSVGISNTMPDSLSARVSRLPNWLSNMAEFVPEPSDTLALLFTALPTRDVRSALGSVTSAGIPFRWIDSTQAVGLALSVTREPGVGGGVNVRASWPVNTGNTVDTSGKRALLLSDAGGILDSIPLSNATLRFNSSAKSNTISNAISNALSNSHQVLSSWKIASVSPPVKLHYVNSKGQSVAAITPLTPQAKKRLLVMALPGWESKFTIAALEESGWQVDGALRISPSAVTRIGEPRSLDTSRYAAVVIVDSMGVDATAIGRFVRQGGGLVISGDAVRIASLNKLLPVSVSSLTPAIAGGLLSQSPRTGLESWRLSQLKSGAGVILLSDSIPGSRPAPAVVARRYGAGRVAAVAYRGLWRWRMEGSDDGLNAHRAWWSDVVSLVLPDLVQVSRAGAALDMSTDGAPYADMVERAGQPIGSLPIAASLGAKAGGDNSGFRFPVRELLFGLIVLSLLSEWASRRLRGAR